jgi:hypothetical protein
MNNNNNNQARILAAAFLLTLVYLVSAQQQTQPQPQQPDTSVKADSVCTTNVTSSKPSPTQQSYVFNTCIVTKFAGYLSMGSDKYFELKDGVVNKQLSQCETTPTANSTGKNPKLVIDFGACAQLDFEFGNEGKMVFVKSINGFHHFANQANVTFANSTRMFETSSKDHYYKCNAEQTVKFNETGDQLVLSNVAFEVYRNVSGTDFYKMPEECALDSSQVSDLVRIGVGVCLVALVALVLIAYFVGRRRWAERSTYESV